MEVGADIKNQLTEVSHKLKFMMQNKPEESWTSKLQRQKVVARKLAPSVLLPKKSSHGPGSIVCAHAHLSVRGEDEVGDQKPTGQAFGDYSYEWLDQAKQEKKMSQGGY